MTIFGTIILSTLLAAAYVLQTESAGAEGTAAESGKQLELESIQTQIEHATTRAGALKQERDALKTEADRLSAKLAETASAVQTREAMITAGESRIAGLNAQEHSLTSDLERRRENLSELLAGLQKLERSPPPPLVAHPDDAVDAIRSSVLFSAVIRALNVQTTALANSLARLENVRAELTFEQRRQREHLAKLARAQADIEKLHIRKLALMRETEKQLEKEARRAQALARKASTLKQLLAALKQARADAIKKEKRAAEIARRKREALLNRPRISFSKARGKLQFPVQGQRRRKFGEKDGFNGRSKGLFIATRANAQVTTPADVRVEFAGVFRSYGQLLILDAGEGYHVLLAGLQTITAKTGQHLRAGEPVGLMGDKPARGTLIGDQMEDQRPILYIEFRKNGGVIDSAPWWVGNRKEARK